MYHKGQNLIICVDASYSMNEPFGNGTKIQDVGDGVEMMLPNLSRQRGTMIGITGFHDRAFVVKPLVFPNNRELIKKVRGIKLGGCTNLLGGIDLACNLLLKRPPCFSRRIIALTDGWHNSGSLLPQQILAKAHRGNIVIDTIGIGNDNSYNQNLLINLSRQTFGEFIAVKDLPKLLASFRRLSTPKSFNPGGGNRGGKPRGGSGGGKGKLIPFNLFRRAA